MHILRSVLGVFFSVLLVSPAFAEPVTVDSFNRSINLLGGKGGPYVKEPSRALSLRTDTEFYGDEGKSLMIKYDKKGEGGPYGNGGWCGYFSELKKGENFFDASTHSTLSFYVKGAEGGENFMIGMADKEWFELGDSVKSNEIGKYLPDGKITTEWQKASIPLSEFALRKDQLASVAVCFETACFDGGAGRGTLYIDEITLE
jgi:hypothetical protein